MTTQSRESQTSPEEQVIDRITAMRKRRPRLTDEVVTLAHGAGGKSSAALVDAVFVEAFRNPELERLGDGALLTLPSDDALGALRAHPLGRDACVIGEIRAEPEGLVALRNAFGGTRIVAMLVGDPLPRIC